MRHTLIQRVTIYCHAAAMAGYAATVALMAIIDFDATCCYALDIYYAVIVFRYTPRRC